jgi:hypothetical protein
LGGEILPSPALTPKSGPFNGKSWRTRVQFDLYRYITR